MEDADDALARTGMALATVWPHLISGLVGLRRDASAGDHLEAAWRLAERLDEPMRRLPVLCGGFAERMWLTGVPDERVTETAPAAVEQAAASPATAWAAGDLAVWLRRLGIAPSYDLARVAEPFRLALSGSHAEAASWWRQVGAVFEEAMAYADSPDAEVRIRGVERLDLLGATAVAERLRRALREEGSHRCRPVPGPAPAPIPPASPTVSSKWRSWWPAGSPTPRSPSDSSSPPSPPTTMCPPCS